MDQVPPINQVTDIHLFAHENQKLLGLPTTQSFQSYRAIARLQPQPDLLLLTGDLSQDGTPASYELLQNLLSPLETPTYCYLVIMTASTPCSRS